MLNSNELLFTVDENNNPIEPKIRSRVHKEGIWHRTTDIAVINQNKEILCSKRSFLKDTNPGLWDPCFGGHILAGTESVDSAVQELHEESGLIADANDLQFGGITKDIDPKNLNNQFRYLYIYKWNGKLADLKLEEDEISEAKWVSLDEITRQRDNREVWVPMPYLDKLLNSV